LGFRKTLEGSLARAFAGNRGDLENLGKPPKELTQEKEVIDRDIE
jgi:hypothetical protein